MKSKFRIYLLFSLLYSLSSCGQNDTQKNTVSPIENNINPVYWNEGLAEISVFTLQQNRYKETHTGNVINVFVQEDFLYEKQVKNDNYTNPKSTKILKNIQIRKFNTGIYDYSVFNSVFTPVQRSKFPNTLKISSSSQEWCGNTYLQLNLGYRDNYDIELRSYFENEGDKNFEIRTNLLEDELYNLLRLNPSMLPIGTIDIIPSAIYLQLQHKEIRSYQANTELKGYKGNDFNGKNLQSYAIRYPKLERTLEIVFENQAPFKIVGWIDTYPSLFDKKSRRTIARLSKTKRLDYWNKNSLSDSKLRSELGL